MLPSFGARADRILQLLLVPAVGAVTSAAQMFIPGATPSLSKIKKIESGWGELTDNQLTTDDLLIND